MRDEVVYMLGVIAVGFVITLAMRALPFLLFAGRDRKLPAWVTRFGSFISPVIIAALIVYSYWGLRVSPGSESEVRAVLTPWPYLAGLLTVALQLWRRNPLVSIVAGTALYMCLLACGCSGPRSLSFDALHPAVRISAQGTHLGDELIDPVDLPGLLASADVPKDRTIHIRLDPEVTNLRYARALMAILARRGYTRSILVTARHGDSFVTGKKKGPQASDRGAGRPPAVPRRIRYKGAGD